MEEISRYQNKYFHLPPNHKEEDVQVVVDRIKQRYKENQDQMAELFKQAKFEAIGCDMTFYDKFLCLENVKTRKTLPQLLLAIKAFNKSKSKGVYVDEMKIQNYLASNGYDYNKVKKTINELDEVVIEENIDIKDKTTEFKFNQENLSTFLIQNAIGQDFQIDPESYSVDRGEFLRVYEKDLKFNQIKSIPSFNKKKAKCKDYKGFDSKFSENSNKGGFIENPVYNVLSTPVKKFDNISSNLTDNMKNSISINFNESNSESFEPYFKILEPYFYFKIKNVSISDKGQVYLINKNNSLAEIKQFIANLSKSFDSIKDISKKSVYELLQFQTQEIDNLNISESKLNFLLLKGSCKYYEREYFKELIERFLTHSSGRVKSIFDEETSYVDKLEVIYRNTEIEANDKIFSNHTLNFASKERELIIVWGCVFNFIRCGLYNESIKFLKETFNGIDENVNFFIEILRKLEVDEDYTDSDFAIIHDMKKTLISTESKNLFKLACYIFISKTPDDLITTFISSIETYIWIHLRWLNISEKMQNLRFKQFGYSDKIEQFQHKILRLNSNIVSNLDSYTLIKIWISVRFYEKSLSDFMGNKSLILDNLCLSFIYREFGLLDENELKGIMKGVIEPFSDLFIKNKIVQIVCVYYLLNQKSFVNDISELIIKHNLYKILKDPKSYFLNIKSDYKILMIDMIDSGTIKTILKYMVDFSMKHEVKDNYKQLVEIAKLNRSLEELTQLLIIGQISLLKKNVPSKILNADIHKKDYLIDFTTNEKYRISEIMGEELKILKNSALSGSTQMNFNLLKELICIGEIYKSLEDDKKEQYDLLIKKFEEKISLLPQKEISINSEILDKYFNYPSEVKAFIPEIAYFVYRLIILEREKMKEINKKKYIPSNNLLSSDQNSTTLTNILNFIERIIERRGKERESIKGIQKYNQVRNLINSFFSVDQD